MKAQMMRLGFSQDWTREYVTMTPEYQAKTQLSFQRCTSRASSTGRCTCELVPAAKQP